jgi:hypothetical protein
VGGHVCEVVLVLLGGLGGVFGDRILAGSADTAFVPDAERESGRRVREEASLREDVKEK